MSFKKKLMNEQGTFQAITEWGVEAVSGNDKYVERAVVDTGNGKCGLIWAITVAYPDQWQAPL